MTNEQRTSTINALLHERNIYQKRGDENGVNEVNAELRKLGHDATTPQQRAERRPATQKRKTETR